MMEDSHWNGGDLSARDRSKDEATPAVDENGSWLAPSPKGCQKRRKGVGTQSCLSPAHSPQGEERGLTRPLRPCSDTPPGEMSLLLQLCSGARFLAYAVGAAGCCLASGSEGMRAWEPRRCALERQVS